MARDTTMRIPSTRIRTFDNLAVISTPALTGVVRELPAERRQAFRRPVDGMVRRHHLVLPLKAEQVLAEFWDKEQQGLANEFRCPGGT